MAFNDLKIRKLGMQVQYLNTDFLKMLIKVGNIHYVIELYLVYDDVKVN